MSDLQARMAGSLRDLIVVAKFAAMVDLLGIPANANGPLPTAIKVLAEYEATLTAPASVGEEHEDMVAEMCAAIQNPLPAQDAAHAQRAECSERFVYLHETRDGVWAHFSAGSNHYSVNLSADEASRPFALAYHNATKAAAPQAGSQK